jgi:hypothetical protein
MLEIIQGLNRKYDQMKEPWRMLTCIALVVPALAALTMGATHLGLVARGLAGVWLIFLTYARMNAFYR